MGVTGPGAESGLRRKNALALVAALSIVQAVILAYYVVALALLSQGRSADTLRVATLAGLLVLAGLNVVGAFTLLLRQRAWAWWLVAALQPANLVAILVVDALWLHGIFPLVTAILLIVAARRRPA